MKSSDEPTRLTACFSLWCKQVWVTTPFFPSFLFSFFFLPPFLFALHSFRVDVCAKMANLDCFLVTLLYVHNIFTEKITNLINLGILYRNRKVHSC